MAGLERCPATRSGQPVYGMDSPDCLIEFDAVDGGSWDRIKVVLACALAELFDGYVTQIDHKNAEGFLFLDKTDTLNFIRFSDVDYQKLFAPFEDRLSLAFSNKKVAYRTETYKAVCILHDHEKNLYFSATFMDKKIKTAELVAFIKCFVQYKRAQVI